jgi:NADH-quinone oxidoreductase subunit F
MKVGMYESPHFVIPQVKNLADFDTYLAHGGFGAYRKAIAMTPDDLINEVKKSGLRGRGGAGFGTGLKWSFMPKGDMVKYLAINGDESEPGSFKDRLIFEQNPFQLIEGIMIAGYAMNIHTGYLYIRGEYHKWVKIMEDAVETAYKRGFLGEAMKATFGHEYKIEIVVHKGAGAYICGEETALMTSLEGDRAYPRVKPPFPAQKGLWAKPTTINNVETIATVPAILTYGPDEYVKIGEPGHAGTLLYGVSGHVNKPGVYELPTNTLLTDIIYNVCGGVRNNKKIKAVIPGGSSMPVLRADEIEGVRMNEEVLKKLGTHIGTGGIMVMDEDTDIVKVTLRIARFYHHESCGQCTPCREGCGWMEKVLRRIIAGNATIEDLDMLYGVASNIEGNTICALGDAAAWPVKAFLSKFRSEFEARVQTRRTFIPVNVVHGVRHKAEKMEVLA